MTRVSVALATFNGARFLPEQLASLAAQTRLPDELVVGDDGSTDGTLALLEDFAATAPFPVRVTRHPAALGPAGNFAATIARCSGDVVFLCDQDDVWRREKIATVLARRAADPLAWVIFHDAALVDGEGAPLGRTMAEQLASAGDNPAEALVAGCCMAIDARLIPAFVPPPRTEFHDAWLHAIAARFGLTRFEPAPLIDYRRHGANVSQSALWRRGAAGALDLAGQRVGRALGQSARARLAQAVAARGDALAAVERLAGVLTGVAGAEQFAAGRAALAADLAREERRLALLEGPLSHRPGAAWRGWRAGDYRGRAGALSLLRDLFDWRR